MKNNNGKIIGGETTNVVSPFLLGSYRKKKLAQLIKRANTYKMLYEQAERELDEYLDNISDGNKRLGKVNLKK